MKALTVRQPWAALLILGAKQYETRTWPTRHRGILLIHAERTSLFAGIRRWLGWV
jgi:hypothetical protein